jgi:hypothetical protein
MAVQLFGIRHHGPGGARALRAALEALQPDCILVEGPPDAQAALPLLLHTEMRPPVALLVYMPAQPSRAVYYPFTTFSPEWQALTFGLSRDIPTRFFDLPQAIQFALEERDGNTEDTENPTEGHGKKHRPSAKGANVRDESQRVNPCQGRQRINPRLWADGHEGHLRGLGYVLGCEGSLRGGTPLGASSGAGSVAVADPDVRDDPLALLAEAAGYSDHELWWEQQIEQRQDATDLFAGILEAMTALRASQPPRRADEALREAHMRQQIRAATSEGFQRIAVVCGAWHAPALVDHADGTADAALLKGLPKATVAATWIPWTNARLAYRSGYGAGVTSPGWYEHLWTAPDRGTIRWLARVAEVLRGAGFDVSSANVIEAVRLAETLAALRELPMPGLAEMHEATQTVLCHGQAEPLEVVRDQVEIGDRMGAVPPETPAVPLQRDLEAQQRRLRMEATTAITILELDLREDAHRAKSRLLHRLRVLDIAWGTPQRVSGKMGTFWEHWSLQWQVEFAVRIIEANIWGNTVEAAAAARARRRADEATELPQLTDLLNQVIVADLSEGVEHILTRVQIQAAIAADVRQLMLALPPLARVARYSDVRGTKSEQITPVIAALFERVLVGLPPACAALDDDAAQQMAESLDAVRDCITMLDDASMRAAWHTALAPLLDDDAIHGLIRGQICRLLLDAGALTPDELHRRARLALATAVPAHDAAAWVEGVLRGSGTLLLHQDALLRALDRWLADLAPDTFVALLPLLRRSFATFEAPERRALGDKAKHLHDHDGQTPVARDGDALPLDRARADQVLPALAALLGAPLPENAV